MKAPDSKQQGADLPLQDLAEKNRTFMGFPKGSFFTGSAKRSKICSTGFPSLRPDHSGPPLLPSNNLLLRRGGLQSLFSPRRKTFGTIEWKHMQPGLPL